MMRSAQFSPTNWVQSAHGTYSRCMPLRRRRSHEPALMRGTNEGGEVSRTGLSGSTNVPQGERGALTWLMTAPAFSFAPLLSSKATRLHGNLANSPARTETIPCEKDERSDAPAPRAPPPATRPHPREEAPPARERRVPKPRRPGAAPTFDRGASD